MQWTIIKKIVDIHNNNHTGRKGDTKNTQKHCLKQSPQGYPILKTEQNFALGLVMWFYSVWWMRKKHYKPLPSNTKSLELRKDAWILP